MDRHTVVHPHMCISFLHLLQQSSTDWAASATEVVSTVLEKSDISVLAELVSSEGCERQSIPCLSPSYALQFFVGF